MARCVTGETASGWTERGRSVANGLFITFEGPDGAGKTTQLRRLASFLTSRLKRPVVTTREPGGTRIGDAIRAILLDPAHAELCREAEMLLYAASRAQHVAERIRPALAAGAVVLCDRYVDASLAYQAYGLGIDPAVVVAVNRFATGGLLPHRTYLLDIDPSEGLRRVRARGGPGADRIEQKALAYHQRVREAFLRLAADDPQRIRVIDASRPEEEIAREIAADCWALCQRLLPEMGGAGDETGCGCGPGQG